MLSFDEQFMYSNAGQVRKSLSIKHHADGTGYLISLSKYSICSYLHFSLNSLNMLHFLSFICFLHELLLQLNRGVVVITISS